jgi:hypothetical protein
MSKKFFVSSTGPSSLPDNQSGSAYEECKEPQHSDSEIEAAARTINNAILVMSKLGDKHPREYIQQFVNEWYRDSGDTQKVQNIISFIEDGSHRKMALEHLSTLVEKQRQIDNAWLTQKGRDVIYGLFTGLFIGGIFPFLGYAHVNADTGSIKPADIEEEDNRRRPFENIGVTLSSLTWAVMLYFILSD